MKKVVSYKGLIGAAAATVCCIVSAMTVMAGHWMANEVGYWYVHDDGSYPVYSWEWIDTDGDGIYQCYAFDENGYLYMNTVTPDGYAVGPDGSWHDGFQPVSRGFLHRASVAPTAIGGGSGKVVNEQEEVEYTYASDGTLLVTSKYSSPKNKKNTSGSSKSSSSKKSGSGTKTSTGIPSSQLVTSKIVSGGSSSGDNASGTTTSNPDYTAPDVDNTSYDTSGPGKNIPSNYSSQSYSPTTDESTIDVSGPKKSGVIERDGYEDSDQSDDDEDDED